jgi:DNA recombination-dependent growth factor C
MVILRLCDKRHNSWSKPRRLSETLIHKCYKNVTICLRTEKIMLPGICNASINNADFKMMRDVALKTVKFKFHCMPSKCY